MAFGTAVLGEDRVQQGRHHGALTFADEGHGIAHEMHTAALPGRVEYLGNSRLEPSWASEMTSFTPRKPRRMRLRRKSVQNGSASDGPTRWRSFGIFRST